MKISIPAACPGRIYPFALGMLILLSACSTEGYRKAADAEALGIIREKQDVVFGEERPFAVEVAEEDQARVELKNSVEKAKGGEGQTPEPLKLDLARSLEAAAIYSRDFQNQKETLFLSALSLSTTRWEFDWQPSLTGAIGIDGNRRNADVSSSASFGFSKTLRTGASILGSLLTGLSRSITSSASWDRSSLLAIGLTQPLLRGFGPDIALESLTQAERNVIYALRRFERFRRREVVQITSDYYGLLQQLDRIDIEKANLENLQVSYELQAALYQAGKTPKFQVDQNQQSVLTSEATLLRLRESLKNSLDAYKIALGLPMETEIVLDRGEFEELQKRGIKDLNINEDRAITIALENRLDLKTTEDEVADAKRQVVIAADALRTGLDLDLGVNIPSQERHPWQPEWKNVTFAGGLSWDLPIDRTRQRNVYRGAIISYERAVRENDLLLDTVKREVRAEVRDLRQIEQDYKIQERRVKLSKSQVDETNEKIRAGRAITRDLLDAQESLVSAQSQLSNLLVNYKTTQLDLLRDLDILKLDPEGLEYDDRLETYRPREGSGK